jgi:hypothetical protein
LNHQAKLLCENLDTRLLSSHLFPDLVEVRMVWSELRAYPSLIFSQAEFYQVLFLTTKQ